MDDHRIRLEIEHTDLEERTGAGGPMNMVTSSVSNFRMWLRSAWSMSSSATWCFRAESPVRI
ncbi:MAG TPA: hypothetical protein VIK04_08535 [Solirubrobacteraceae bacterium]